MKIENGKIVEATEDELFRKYLGEDWDDCMPFNEYKYRVIQSGVTIKEDNNDDNS